MIELWGAVANDLGGSSEVAVATLTAPLRRMPFATGALDAVQALNVLYFADRDGAMIAELHRVLRPVGGWSPTSPKTRAWNSGRLWQRDCTGFMMRRVSNRRWSRRGLQRTPSRCMSSRWPVR